MTAKTFRPGIDLIRYAGHLFDEKELVALMRVAMDTWIAAGPRAHEFELAFARYLGVAHALLVNSGSSANLIALSALTAAAPSSGRSSAPSMARTRASRPPAMIPCTWLGSVPNVGGHSAASRTPSRPLVPAPM